MPTDSTRSRRQSLHVFLSPEEREQLEDVSADKRLSVSDTVRSLIRAAAVAVYAKESGEA